MTASPSSLRVRLAVVEQQEQRNLRSYFRQEVDVSRYDRIVFFLRFKQEIRQVEIYPTIPNLVILEHDAYQNYIPCKYTGKFSAHYRQACPGRG